MVTKNFLAGLPRPAMRRVGSVARLATILSALVLFAATPGSAVLAGGRPSISGDIRDFRTNQPVNQGFLTWVDITNNEDRPVWVDAVITPQGSLRLTAGDRKAAIIPSHGTTSLSWQTIRVSHTPGGVNADLRPRFVDSVMARDWAESLGLWQDAQGGIWRKFKNHHPRRSLQFSVVGDRRETHWTNPVAPGGVASTLVGRNGDNRASLEGSKWWAKWVD